MSRTSHARTAVPLLAAALLVTAMPFSAFADNSAGQPDDLVVVIKPRGAAVHGDAVVAQAIDGLFVFDWELYHANGAPYYATRYGFDVNTLDGQQNDEENPGAAPGARLAWSEEFQVTSTSKGTVRVPSAALKLHETPFGGVALTINVFADGAGASLLDANGFAPSGQFSLAANEAVANGQWDGADAADEVFTPLLLVDGDLTGLVQAGNPLLNPGFELGLGDGGEQTSGTAAEQPATPAGARSSHAGWFLTLFGPGVSADETTTPASFHHYGGQDGLSGGYVDVVYDAADNGQVLGLTQFLTPPTAQSAWVGSSDVEACFDARFYDEAGEMPTFYVLTNVFGSGQTSSYKPDVGVEIPADGVWRHYCLSFGSDLAGVELKQFYFNFYYGTAHREPLYPATQYANAKPHVQLDNAVLRGVTLQGATLKHDLHDGYSVFILPQGASLVQGQDVVQKLSGLGGAKTAYVYEVAALDYTGIAPRPVDVPNADNMVFELLDERDVPPTVSDGQGSVWTSSAQSLFRFLEADGSVSPNLLVVADPAAFSRTPQTGGAGAVPWFFVQANPSGESSYEDVFGETAEPAAGYYSVARNALMGSSLSDQLDYLAQPVSFSPEIGQELASTPTVTLTCAAGPGNACSTGNPTVRIAYESPGRVLESVGLRLVSAADSSHVLRSVVVDAPSGSVDVTLLASEIAALEAATGSLDLRVLADAATFQDAASSNVLDLGNVVPTAAYRLVNEDPITRLTTVVLEDVSTDADGAIAQSTWTYEDPDGVETTVGGRTLTIVNPPTRGTWSFTLTTQDDEGAPDSVSGTFEVVNVGPLAAIEAPAFAPLGAVTFTSASADPDGEIASYAWSLDGATVTGTAGAYEVLATTEGPLTAYLTVADADGETASASATVLVDGTAPVTTLEVDQDPEENWTTSAVSYVLERSDAGGSGVVETVVVLDGVETVFEGSDPIEGVFDTSGNHTLVAYTVDGAGNVGNVVTRFFKVDLSDPDVAITNPQMLGPVIGVYAMGEPVEVTASATDDVSRVVSVQLFVDGVLAATDADATDGWSASLDTAGLAPGVHELTAVATNEAGRVKGVAQAVWFVVVGAPAF